VIIRECILCRRRAGDGSVEHASVRSNVRAFRHETFALWRCPQCGTIHARDEVDLGHYYAKYPFHDLPIDWRINAMYGNFRERLVRAGLKPEHRILDFGCGGGTFVKYLKSSGYANVVGFDEYSKDFGDKSVLKERYDCVVSQDVIEHVASPKALVTQFDGLANPGGLIVIGTPNATAIDLRRPEDFVHTLHAPYHRHILSKEALLQLGERQGWSLLHFYPTMYSNTRFPFVNEAFYLHFTRMTDSTLDAFMEPIKPIPFLLHGPETLYWALFGRFYSRHTDVMAIFRRGG
jgi:2-polyprenyl-3-methyl-5-hydroxy-6-metoxy-1,4-benzoquinol methylase